MPVLGLLPSSVRQVFARWQSLLPNSCKPPGTPLHTSNFGTHILHPSCPTRHLSEYFCKHGPMLAEAVMATRALDLALDVSSVWYEEGVGCSCAVPASWLLLHGALGNSDASALCQLSVYESKRNIFHRTAKAKQYSLVSPFPSIPLL